jgi:hypothetical protein
LEHAARVVRAYASVWDRHREILRFRNLEADRGDGMFEEIRLRTALRLVKRFADHIMEAHRDDPRFTQRDAMAEASVLVCAMERCAAIDPKLVEQGVGAEAMYSALARIIADTLLGSRPGNNSRFAPARKEKAKTAGR